MEVTAQSFRSWAVELEVMVADSKRSEILCLGFFKLHFVLCSIKMIRSTWRETGKERKVEE